MQPGPPIAPNLVLLGGGHAHVEVLRRFAKNPLPGLCIALLAREALTPYTGLLPAVVRGELASAAAHIDLAPLAAAAGARLIVAEATRLDLANRRVLLSDHPPLGFDVLSIDVGGIPATPPGGIAVRPLGSFLAALASLEVSLPPDARIVVVGGGAGGVELALALARRLTPRARIHLVAASRDVLPKAPLQARRIARRALAMASVYLTLGSFVENFTDGTLHLADGRAIAADAALFATGVVGPPFLAAAGLLCDASGFVRVASSLQSLSHPFVFAAGDCATIEGFPRPKAGVFAVRAGPVLAQNIRRAVLGQSLRRWRPQLHALAIIALGDGRALTWRGDFALSGRLVQLWKERIDRRWMAMYAPDALRKLHCISASPGTTQTDASIVPRSAWRKWWKQTLR